MDGAELQRHVLDTVEWELANVGLVITPARRRYMAWVLERIDRAHTPEARRALCAELESELQLLNNHHAPVACDPAVWLGTVECA